MDENGNGYLEFREMSEFLEKNFNLSLDHQQMEMIFRRFADSKDQINYEQFISVINKSHYDISKIKSAVQSL